MRDFTPYDFLPSITTAHQFDFRRKEPFHHTVIKDLLDSRLLMKAVNQIGDYQQQNAYKYDNVFEKKMAYNNMRKMPTLCRQLIRELNSNPFVDWVSEVTKIPNLIPDPYLNGGGLHMIPRHGFLRVHADYNIYKQLNLLRRVNLILYLNPEWKSEYGGQLELWNSDMTKCVKKIEPNFNTLVLFESDDKSFHGHPHPLQCPEGMWRRSLALYFYTNPNSNEHIKPHSTLYQRLPNEPIDPVIEELREKRSKGRI